MLTMLLALQAATSLQIRTDAGDVSVRISRSAGFVSIAATLPDSTYYWGDDFVISVDPDGSGGPAPGDGDRQWYLRRTLDSSVVLTAANGRWMQPGVPTPMLGATRSGPDWDVSSSSTSSGWSVELRIRESALRREARIAFRTYNDAPQGWWSWPAPPAGMPAQRVERNPGLWIPLDTR